MKIGEFAARYDLSHDTVRYYMQKGLLKAVKNGGQYEFTPHDCQDMVEIQKLKDLDFSLSEIQQILSYKRITGLKNDEEQHHYRQYFVSKHEELKTLETVLKEKKAVLAGIIHHKKTEEKEGMQKGFPLSFLQHLQCPCCHTALNIEDGKIANTMVMEAVIGCTCGYHAMIENGIYVDPQSIRGKMLNGQTPPSKEEFVQNTSPKFINFLATGIHKVHEKLAAQMKAGSVVLEVSSCIGFILSQVVERLSAQTTYLMTDYDYHRVKKCKRGFEKGYDHLTFIYFACDMHRLPLADGCVNHIVDYCGIKHYSEQHQLFLPEVLKRHLKQGGSMVGAYHFFEADTRGFQAVSPSVRRYYEKSYLRDNLKSTGLKLISEEVVGPVNEGGKYNAFVDDNDLYQLIYAVEAATLS